MTRTRLSPDRDRCQRRPSPCPNRAALHQIAHDLFEGLFRRECEWGHTFALWGSASGECEWGQVSASGVTPSLFAFLRAVRVGSGSASGVTPLLFAFLQCEWGHTFARVGSHLRSLLFFGRAPPLVGRTSLESPFRGGFRPSAPTDGSEILPDARAEGSSATWHDRYVLSSPTPSTT